MHLAAEKNMSVASSTTNIAHQRPPSAPLRNRIQGGYVLGPKAILEWAERLSGESLTGLAYTYSFIAPVVEAYGVRFAMVGEVSEKHWMIVTQSRNFMGWKDMDPSLIPQFQEGPREALARDLLVKQGVTEFEFRTFLG